MKWIPVTYLHRYLRVSPAYFFSFLIHWKIAPLLAEGEEEFEDIEEVVVVVVM